MKEINRIIVSAVILSKDNKILMGRKDPSKGGVYSDCWHIPGGGVDEGESLQVALVREVKEEIGVDISKYPICRLLYVDMDVSEKILKGTSEKVLCHMEFNRFEVKINDKIANEIVLKLDDDLVETRWFAKDELPYIKQVPHGKAFFKQAGYID